MTVSPQSLKQFVLHQGEDGSEIKLFDAATLGPSPFYREDLKYHPDWIPACPTIDHAGYDAPALSIRIFKDALVTRRHGIVLDSENRIVPETASGSRYVDPNLANVPDLDIIGENLARLSAVGHSSLSAAEQPLLWTLHGGYTVFGHFLYETMGTIWAIRPLVMSGDVQLLMPPSGYLWPNSMLDALGVPSASRYQSAFANIRAKHLVVSSSTWGRQTFQPMPMMREMVKALKEWNGAKPGKRRLYLTRAGAATTSGRFVANETALFEMLAGFGFIAVEPSRYSFAQQVRIFSQAEVIVGLHGSAFANAIFADPGSTVIDLLPDYWALDGGGRWTRNFCNMFDLQYAYHIGQSQKTHQGYAVMVEVEALREKLALLFA